MKVVQIAGYASGSIKTISLNISDYLSQKGIENYIFYSFNDIQKDNGYFYANKAEIKANALASRIQGNYGFNSKRITERLIQKLKELQPDIIQLHNLHSHDINLDLLFTYLKEINIPVVYTFHDCWAFTGYCPYYTYARCNQWESGCKKCLLRNRYSWFQDRSNILYNKKKELLTGLKQLTIVTPSKWLKEEVSKSFLREKECVVIPNGIDLKIFKPAQNRVKELLGIQDKKMVLAVAFHLAEAKGANDLLKLNELLPKNYRLVLVGLNEKEIASLPKNIIGVPRTNSQKELAEYYTAADLFINPTHEDNFPTVNLEALACGTPIVAYDVGGACEAFDSSTGIAVEENDIGGLRDAILKIMSKPKTCYPCREHALQYCDYTKMAEAYYELYVRSLKGK